MEIITNLQVKLCSCYNNGEIDESELVDKLRYVKEVHDDMAQLKQSMVDMCNAPMDELCNTEDTIDKISNIYKELMGKYDILKSCMPDSVDEHMRSVYNIMGYHMQLMVMYNNGDITAEVFVDEMGDACDLNRPVYKDIVDQVNELLVGLVSYPVTNADSVKWMKIVDVSNIVIRELYTSEYGKHEDEELQKLYTEYLKQSYSVSRYI